MKELLTPHSLGDWYYQPAIAYQISTAHYVSPPSSLSVNPPSGFNRGFTYLGNTLGLCIPQGQVVTHFREYVVTRYFLFLFRAQEYATLYPPNNHYCCRIYNNTYLIFKRVQAVTTNLASGPLPNPFSANEWVKFRITWAEWVDADLNLYLRIVLDREVDGEWVEQALVNDPDPTWSDSQTNRCGFALEGYPSPSTTWVDDTEIWKKA